LLWVKTTSGNPASGVAPLGTRITDYNVGTGYPFTTYYFRARIHADTVAPGARLRLLARIDDGAVLYINGNEVLRIRMDAFPAPILNGSFATGYGCGGDATCDEEFEIDASLLRPGDNVIAAEVHNYNARSADITFGMQVSLVQPANSQPVLQLVSGDGVVRLQWERGGFALQEATDPSGPWLDVPGPQLMGPVVRPLDDVIRFYRLAR
jgi:hypothetical protein